MPEGPELHLASRFVNRICQGKVFSGKVIKSAVSLKNPDVEWDEPVYSISATSRGKEVKLILTSGSDGLKNTKADQKSKTKKNTSKSMSILFRFGMSGKFTYDPVTELHKHAHLQFFTDEGKDALCFVDFRRFGRWEINGDWGPRRGPCVLFEYEKFREKVLNNLNKAAFNRPICEALLNQEYFNGIGNYLRAEILYRCKVVPFVEARKVLEPLKIDNSDVKIKNEDPDVLELCNILPLEVINLSGGKGYDPEAKEGDGNDYSAFAAWLQCYYNPEMKNMVDNNKRTIWFAGEPGPMVPKEKQTRGRKKKSHLNKRKNGEVEENGVEEGETNGASPAKRVRNTRNGVKVKAEAKKKPEAKKNVSKKSVKSKKDVEKTTKERKTVKTKKDSEIKAKAVKTPKAVTKKRKENLVVKTPQASKSKRKPASLPTRRSCRSSST